ncbi:MAG: phosphatase PAP2 family protein [Pseudonocardiales bacterium]
MRAADEEGMRRAGRPLLPAVLGVAVAGALAALTADVLRRGLLHRLDWRLHLQVDAHVHDGPVQTVAMVLSLVGQRGIVVVPLLVLAVLAARRHHSLRPVIVAVGALVGIALLVLLFKAAVGRVAPSSGHDGVHAGGSSYPSGHAINAIVCWGLVLELAASLGGRARWVLGPLRRRLATAGLAALAGLSMIVLDYHWLSDVLAGWLLGVLVLGIVLAAAPVRARPVSSAARPGSARPVPSG